jgi:hypothetical protein
VWLVSRQQVDETLDTTRVVRVKVGSGWQCAVVDRSRLVAVDRMLLREVIASDPDDCPECAALLASLEPSSSGQAAQPVSLAREVQSAEVPGGTADLSRPGIQAAAISLEDHQLLVVLVRRDLLQSPGEANMVITDLRARFGGVDVVLMGQDEDGTPHYHGEPELVGLLNHVPVDQLPWKSYP